MNSQVGLVYAKLDAARGPSSDHLLERHQDSECAVVKGIDIPGVPELSSEEHGGLEHRERPPRLHRRQHEHRTDVPAVLQLRSEL